MEENNTRPPHSLMIENRTQGVITGVKDVDCFDESQILLLTEEGKLLIKGEKLHVRQLDLEKGKVELEGRTDSFSYLSRQSPQTKDSLLKRMFR